MPLRPCGLGLMCEGLLSKESHTGHSDQEVVVGQWVCRAKPLAGGAMVPWFAHFELVFSDRMSLGHMSCSSVVLGVSLLLGGGIGCLVYW